MSVNIYDPSADKLQPIAGTPQDTLDYLSDKFAPFSGTTSGTVNIRRRI